MPSNKTIKQCTDWRISWTQCVVSLLHTCVSISQYTGSWACMYDPATMVCSIFCWLPPCAGSPVRTGESQIIWVIQCFYDGMTCISHTLLFHSGLTLKLSCMCELLPSVAESFSLTVCLWPSPPIYCTIFRVGCMHVFGVGVCMYLG